MEICQTDLSEFHPTVWEKSPEVSTKKIYHAVWQLLLYFYREFPCARSSERSCERKLKKNILFLEGFFFNQ